MRALRFLLVAVFATVFFIPAHAQRQYSPIVLYWKTLEPQEKELYLFAYLTQVYDTHTSLVEETGRGELTQWYYKNRAELAYNVLELLEKKGASVFIEWVDDFYRQDEFKDLPFHEALSYAYLRSQMTGQTLLEKYESLFGEPDTTAE